VVDAGGACGGDDVRGFDLAAARYCCRRSASSDAAGPATCAHVGGAGAGAGAWAASAGRTGGEGGDAGEGCAAGGDGAGEGCAAGGDGAKAGGEDGVTDGMLHVSSTIDTM